MSAKKSSDSASLFDQGTTKVEESPRTFKLGRFVENPDNPQTVTDAAFERLVGKLKRVPSGLTAKRIAYVTDHEAGEFVVLSGNKRIRALKRILGEEYEAPAEWFQDVTEMSADERREFIVTENVVEGDWVASMLLALMPKEELAKLMDDTDVSAILADLPAVQKIAENQEIDGDEFADTMELKFKLTVEDREKAVAVLASINPDDQAAAFMELVGGASK